MCYNCGCRNPQDDMGHPDNITEQTFAHLAKHRGKTLPETKSEVLKILESGQINDPHILEMLEKASKAWGQSIEEAKRNTISLLKEEVGSS